MTTPNGASPYHRILLKLSGEALSGDKDTPIDMSKADFIAEKLQQIYDLGVQIAVVVGAGNIWRGNMGRGMDRTTADHMGMIGTVMNGLALRDAPCILLLSCNGRPHKVSPTPSCLFCGKKKGLAFEIANPFA